MQNVVLITGASTGIGFDLAHEFAKKGFNLLLVSRSKDKLLDLRKNLEFQYKVQADLFPVDLSKPSAPQQVYNYCQKQKHEIAILVNNAGFGTNGEFASLDLDRELEMIDLNVKTLVSLSHLFAADMKSRKNGKILNVASTAAFQPGPFMANYYASKAYVQSFSEGIREELLPSGITVTSLCPGPTRTPFFAVAGVEKNPLLNGPLAMDSRTVAKKAVMATLRGKAIVITGFTNWLMMESVRITPRILVRKIAGFLNSKK